VYLIRRERSYPAFVPKEMQEIRFTDHIVYKKSFPHFPEAIPEQTLLKS